MGREADYYEWSKQLSIFRMRAEFRSQKELARALQLKGYDISYGMVRQYESGNPPKKRGRHIELISFFKSCGAIVEPSEALSWLSLANQPGLNPKESSRIFSELVSIGVYVKGITLQELTELKVNQFIETLSKLLGVDPDDIDIDGIDEGSVRYRLKMSAEASERLLELALAKHDELLDLNIVLINIGDDSLLVDLSHLKNIEDARILQKLRKTGIKKQDNLLLAALDQQAVDLSDTTGFLQRLRTRLVSLSNISKSVNQLPTDLRKTTGTVEFRRLAFITALFLLIFLCSLGALGSALSYSSGWLVGILPDQSSTPSAHTNIVGTATPTPAAMHTPTSERPEIKATLKLPPSTAELLTPVLRPTLAEKPPPSTMEATGEIGPNLLLSNLVACLPGQVAEFNLGHSIHFEWRFVDTLENGEYLEIRVGPAKRDPLPVIGGQLPLSLSSGQNWFQRLEVADFAINGVTDYEWQIAHMGADETAISLSERGCLRIGN